MEKVIYNVGDVLVSINNNYSVNGYVGADNNIHYENGEIELLKSNFRTKGYNTDGIATWIYKCLLSEIPIQDMLEDYDESKTKFIKCISNSLKELGMFDHNYN